MKGFQITDKLNRQLRSGISPDDLANLVTTFPLVDESVKSQTLNTYREIVKLGKFAENALTNHP